MEVETGGAQSDRHTFTGINALTHTHSHTVDGIRIFHLFPFLWAVNQELFPYTNFSKVCMSWFEVNFLKFQN